MLAWLERHQIKIFAAAVLALAATLAATAFAGDEPPSGLVIQTGSSLPAGAPIRVHVAGAVVAPGVYDLREGDRLVDALALAGGPTDDADLEALNLARRVRDEEQVLVPRRERAAVPRVEPLHSGGQLDINTATAAQLDQLPGIGEAYSRRIVDSRRVDGPFRTIEELVDRRVVPRATLDGIRALITVGP
jgi:competence protein ComEA